MGQYSEKISYADARGNIAAIQRYGVIPGASYPSGMIDNLSFTIKPGSNQLQRVADGAPTEFAQRGFKPATGAQNIDYTYDPVGNQTSDPHKGITVTYNYLNLPSVILWSNGNKMEMSYDAMGTKLSKKVSVGATEQYTQHYLGGIEYNAVGATRKLEAIYFADGRVYNTNVTTASTTVAFRYEYAIRDHLGNTRLMFADLDNLGTISSNEILQENHYYPFGMNMEGVWMNDAGAKDSKYQYNGKELNDDFGLNWNDYGARWYDAGIGRWNAGDPMASKFPSLNTYNFSLNNPARITDPDGKAPFDVIIKGSEKQAALNELQASVKGQLTLSMAGNGKVKYTQDGGEKLSKDAQQLVNALDDHSIQVNINAESSTTTKTGNLYIGGAFSGNTVISKKVINALSVLFRAGFQTDKNFVSAEQEVNPSVLNKISTAHEKLGADILHEVTEAYQGALISQKSGVSSPVADQPGSVYPQAHSRATNQSGLIFQRIYDASGKELQMLSTGAYPEGVRSADWYVSDKKGNKIVIQELK